MGRYALTCRYNILCFNLLICLSFCDYAFGDVIVTSSKNIPVEYENVVKRAVLDVTISTPETIHVVLGEDALIQAIKTLPKHSRIVVGYVSRYSYETIMIDYYRQVQHLTLSILYFDPSPQQLVALSHRILFSQQPIFETVYLTSWLSEKWVSLEKSIKIRTRQPGQPFKSLLSEGYDQRIFILPADQHLFEDIVFGDLITLLIGNRSGLITFSPNIRNSLASVYFEISDYADELIAAINGPMPFKAYPRNAKYTINPRIAQAIGINPQLIIKHTGYLDEARQYQK